MIGRREFIRLLGSVAAWPVVAQAQQAAVPVIGHYEGKRLRRDRPISGHPSHWFAPLDGGRLPWNVI
jgi:hypothetical protein